MNNRLYESEYLRQRKKALWIDRILWAVSFLLLAGAGLFAEQIVEFWSWLLKSWLF